MMFLLLRLFLDDADHPNRNEQYSIETTTASSSPSSDSIVYPPSCGLMVTSTPPP